MTKTSSNSPLPLYLKGTKEMAPSSRWSSVKKEDIGNGYRQLNAFDSPKVDRTMVVEFGNHFVSGSSPYVFYVVKPRVKVTKRKKQKTPINAHHQVTSKERQRFTNELGQNIEKVSRFFMGEILPMSMALESAIEEVNDKTKQLLEVDANLPKQYLINRASAAISLRITRFISEQYKLTPSEAKMLREGST